MSKESKINGQFPSEREVYESHWYGPNVPPREHELTEFAKARMREAKTSKEVEADSSFVVR